MSVKDKLTAWTKGEPVVVIGSALLLVQTAWTDISGELDAGAGWRAVFVAASAWVIRHFVTPAWKADQEYEKGARDGTRAEAATPKLANGTDPRKDLR